MPAWIAGIQICMDASGDVHVGLHSSNPCWNDETKGFCNLTEVPAPPILEE